MRLTNNISRIVSRTGGKSGGGGTRETNRVVKFRLFCSGER